MWKKAVFAFGGFVTLIGVMGIYNAINSFTKAPVKRTDLTATGVVTDVRCEGMVHKLTGTVLTKQYNLDFKFMTDDGKEIHETDTITEAEAQSLVVGQKLQIRYNSHNPYCCASSYGYYIPVDRLPEPSPLQRLWFCLGTLLFGLLTIFGGLTCKNESPVAVDGVCIRRDDNYEIENDRLRQFAEMARG